MRGKLVLVGAGAHGRGTVEILKARRAAGLGAPEVIGFVDDNPARQGSTIDGHPVLGTVEWLIAHAHQGVVAILAIAAARPKQVLAERLELAGVAFTTAIHPSLQAASGVSFGDGAIVNAGVSIAFDTFVGRHTTINLGATIGHDVTIGDFATIAPGVNVTGKVAIGEGVEIQTNATIVPGLKLGAWSKVGPGSVVLRDVEPGESVFGNPARRVPAVDSGARHA